MFFNNCCRRFFKPASGSTPSASRSADTVSGTPSTSAARQVSARSDACRNNSAAPVSGLICARNEFSSVSFAFVLNSPESRGRSERNFSTWQGRLPQELRLRQLGTLEAANRFLREEYIAEFNRRFQVAPRQRGNAFVPCRSRDLERIFSLQFERSVNRDNTVSFQNLSLQIERVRWRATLAGCQVVVHQHLNGTLSLTHGPHCLGRYDGGGAPLTDRGFYSAEQGKGNCPLPLQPHPQNQPHPNGEGTTLKPDIALATKTGHFNLLPTPVKRPVKRQM